MYITAISHRSGTPQCGALRPDPLPPPTFRPNAALIPHGDSVRTEFQHQHDLPLPVALGSMPLVVNLSRRSLVAKSTEDAVAVTYRTDSDLWSVDVHNFKPDGTPNFWQWVDG